MLPSTRINGLGLAALATMWNLSFAFSARSQTEAVTPPKPPPIVGPLRQLEDHSYLEDPSARSGFWWEPLKYLPLWPTPNAPFVSLGGEVRVCYEWIENTDFGSGPQDAGGYLLTRYIPFVSLTVPDLPGESRLRIFGQFLGAFNHGDARGPGPIDQDTFDVLQAFAELTFPIGEGNLTLQGGRQSISFGTERILGTRYGPNIPLSFDGGLVRWTDERWAAHAFYLRPVPIDPDPLNNVSTVDQQIWGLYATRQLGDVLPGLPNAALDFYYFGFSDAAATYNAGTGRELRHTVGSRVFGGQPVPFGTFDWNYEGIFQFGTFDSERGPGDILAWSAGTETGYTLDAPLTPRFSFRANFVSGDNNPDDANLQTFNPLFPKGKYFGELTPVGPYNLINLQGGLSLRVTDQTTLYLQGGPYWRYSTRDAVYGVGGNIVRAMPSAAGRPSSGTNSKSSPSGAPSGNSRSSRAIHSSRPARSSGKPARLRRSTSSSWKPPSSSSQNPQTFTPKSTMNPRMISAIALLISVSGCVTTTPDRKADLHSAVDDADTAYSRLPSALPAYNAAVRELAERLEKSEPTKFAKSLSQLGVKFDYPQIGLPLHHIEVPASADPTALGTPVVLGYDSSNAALYPPEGLFVDATAVYEHSGRKRRFSLVAGQKSMTVKGHELPLALDPTGASNQLKTRAKRLAKSGFLSMIRPESMTRKPQIYLLEPYDPQKTPLLMVHGLQSTPVAFAMLVNALRMDPEIRSKYQIWQFYYPSGTPVLANAAALRDSLEETLAKLDPDGRAPASRRLVVIGHSMGGVISHTLVSSSGDKVWSSAFRVPTDQLKGDPVAITNLQHILIFKRDPRIGRIIFMAAPFRGSPMADSLIGRIGTSLTQLAPMEETGFTSIARENQAVMQPDAAEFYAGGRFSAVRTLSSKSTALIAVANLPIPIPFHNIMGQQRSGPKERGSDGVVPYWSSHLEGASSELIVRSGHNVISNPEAIAEVIRILHEDQTTTRQ